MLIVMSLHPQLLCVKSCAYVIHKKIISNSPSYHTWKTKQNYV